VTLLEQGISLEVDMGMDWASAWIRLWVLCVLNMPLMTRKRRGFTLELATETKGFTFRCCMVLFIFAWPYFKKVVDIFSVKCVQFS